MTHNPPTHPTQMLDVQLIPMYIGASPSSSKTFGFPCLGATSREYPYLKTKIITLYEEAVEYLGMQEGQRMIVRQGVDLVSWYLHIIPLDSVERGMRTFKKGNCLVMQCKPLYNKKMPSGFFEIGEGRLEESTNKVWYPLNLKPCLK